MKYPDQSDGDFSQGFYEDGGANDQPPITVDLRRNVSRADSDTPAEGLTAEARAHHDYWANRRLAPLESDREIPDEKPERPTDDWVDRLQAQDPPIDYSNIPVRRSHRGALWGAGGVAVLALVGGAYLSSHHSSDPSNKTVATSTPNNQAKKSNVATKPTKNVEQADTSAVSVATLMNVNLCNVDGVKSAEKDLNPVQNYICTAASNGDGKTSMEYAMDRGHSIISIAVASQGDNSNQLIYRYQGKVTVNDAGITQPANIKGLNCDWISLSPSDSRVQGKVSNGALDCFSKPGKNAYQVEIFASNSIPGGDGTNPMMPDQFAPQNVYNQLATGVMGALATAY